MNVSIIGGGVVGCTAAYYLSKSGHSVTLFEKDEIAAHASGFSFGGLLPPLINSKDPLLSLSHFSLELHKKISFDLDQDGFNYYFKRKNSIHLAKKESEMKRLLFLSNQVFSHYQNKPVILNNSELKHIEARLSDKVIGGLHLNCSYDIDTYNFCRSLWESSKKFGAKLIKKEVTKIEVNNNSVKGLKIKDSEEIIPSDHIIVAAGPWSKFIFESLGIEIPLFPVKGQIVRLKTISPPDIKVNFWWGPNYLSTKHDGNIWVGTTEEEVGFNEKPDIQGRKSIINSSVEIFPFIKDLPEVNHTACLRPITKDLKPIIDDFSDLINGLVISTGGGRNGILFGPLMGLRAAEMVMSKKMSIDTSFLSIKRFSI
ncbi:MAG: hypothetical protein CL780_04680 [Chloroflexi bacterium]|nr:hypothetical protein [Chloroflexota bacterium]|tara:strand:+ start:354 stop:1463 length:1110 start_codon:yes stop_codon:yes gene_type:complete